MGKVVQIVAAIGISIAIAVAAPYLGGFLLHAIGTVTATALATSVATGIAASVLAIAAGLVMNAFVGKPSASQAPGNFKQALNDSTIVIGKARVPLKLTFFHPGGKKYRYFVWTVAGHRCKGATTFYLNDQAVSVDGSGKVTSGDYAGGAWLWFDRGTADAVANPVFVAECGGKWTANHRGRGVPKLYAKFEMTKKVVAAGMPTMTVEVEGADEIADPRSGTTGYTNNAELAFYWWMHLPREEGGFGCAADELPDAAFIAANANVCDESVPLKAGGTEKRYAFDGFLTTGSDPSAVRQVLVSNMAGRFTYFGGKMLARPGYWVPPSAMLEEADLVGGVSIDLLATPDGRTSEVTATYNEPSELYQPVELPTRTTDSEDVAQAGLDLPFVKSRTRAQRIQKIALLRGAVDRTVNWPMNVVGLKVAPMDTVQLGTLRYGLNNYAWTVASWQIGADFSIPLKLVEEYPEMYDWDASEEADVIDRPVIGRVDVGAPDAPSASEWTASGTTQSGPGGSLPALLLTGGADEDLLDAILIDYRPSGVRLREDGSAWLNEDSSPRLSEGGAGEWQSAGQQATTMTSMLITNGVAPGAWYDVGVRYVSDGMESDRLVLGPVQAGGLALAVAREASRNVSPVQTGPLMVSVTWQNPRSDTFDHAKLVRDGVEVGGSIAGGLNATPTVTDTVPSTGSYTYVVRAYFDDGGTIDSSGVAVVVA